MSAYLFVGFLYAIIGAGGPPDRSSREEVDHIKRVCAAAEDNSEFDNDYQCIVAEMTRKKAALEQDILNGKWAKR